MGTSACLIQQWTSLRGHYFVSTLLIIMSVHMSFGWLTWGIPL